MNKRKGKGRHPTPAQSHARKHGSTLFMLKGAHSNLSHARHIMKPHHRRELEIILAQIKQLELRVRRDYEPLK